MSATDDPCGAPPLQVQQRAWEAVIALHKCLCDAGHDDLSDLLEMTVMDAMTPIMLRLRALYRDTDA